MADEAGNLSDDSLKAESPQHQSKRSKNASDSGPTGLEDQELQVHVDSKQTPEPTVFAFALSQTKLVSCICYCDPLISLRLINFRLWLSTKQRQLHRQAKRSKWT